MHTNSWFSEDGAEFEVCVCDRPRSSASYLSVRPHHSDHRAPSWTLGSPVTHVHAPLLPTCSAPHLASRQQPLSVPRGADAGRCQATGSPHAQQSSAARVHCPTMNNL